MSLLRKSDLSFRRKAFLFSVAALILITPCVAAAKFGLRLNLTAQDPAVVNQTRVAEESEQKRERAIEDLERQARTLREQMRRANGTQRPLIEARLREVERNLAEHERVMERWAKERENSEDAFQEAKERLEEVYAQLARADRNNPEDRARLAELQKQLERLQDESVKGQIDARLSSAKLEELMRASDEVELQERKQIERFKEGFELKELEKLKADKREMQEGLKKSRDEFQEQEKAFKDKERQKWENEKFKEKIREDEIVNVRRRKGLEEESRAARSQRHIELTRNANISMDRAIQIAISKYPGKTLACSLGRNRDGQLFYHVAIVSGEGEKTGLTYVWVSALDGQIIKAEKE